MTVPDSPRLGFAGVGWIGRHRLNAAAEAGAEVVAVFDPSTAALAEVLAEHPSAEPAETFADLLDRDLDGVVIATPSALHAEQAMAALESGCAVFCQKPLARTAAETRAVVDAARAADRLLGVDLSYRHVQGVGEVRERIGRGEIGTVFAADLTFHNAYGPDKAWFYDLSRAGGGCLIDLGTHLIDLALWTLDFPAAERVGSRLFRAGERLPLPPTAVEDAAFVHCDLAGGTHLRVACSWKLSAGQDAVVGASFYGTDGAFTLRNVGGSFHRFVIEHQQGTTRTTVAEPPETWGGGAVAAWVGRLKQCPRCRDDSDSLLAVAELLDRSYGR